jgi:hypothetical protein
MKTTTTLTLGFLSLLASCKLPPNLTWHNVQTQGLIPVISQTAAPVQTDAQPKIEMSSPQTGDAPVAEVVPGRAGYVYSPFTNPRRVVDVRDFKVGEEVRCPITFRSFVVPDGSSAKTAATKPASVQGPRNPSRPRIVEPAKSEAPKTQPSPQITTNPMVKPQAPVAPAPAPAPQESKKMEAAPPTQAAPAPNAESLPTAKWVPNRPGFVYSPFATKFQLVDVAGISAGVEVRCPYTGKLFRVPPPEANAAPAPADKPKEPAPAPTEMKKEEKPKETPAPAPADKPKEEPKKEEPKKEEPKKEEPKKEEPKEMKNEPAAGNAQAGESLPTASWSDKDKNLVQSPYGQPGQLVDVSGKSGGAKVVCPFTGKTFVVPGK